MHAHSSGAVSPDPPCESGFFGTTPRRPTMSERLWGIRFCELLPVEVTRGIRAVVSDFERTMAFALDNYSTIFESDPRDMRFFPDPMTDSKRRYYLEMGDFFEFIEGDRTVGFLILTPHDWSTCYIRGAGSLPSHQGKRLGSRLLAHLTGPLRDAGVQRLEADTSPSNLAVIHLLARDRYNPTGMVLTDRWGTHVKLTKFLSRPAEDVFLQQYCTGINYQQRGADDAPQE
jgi:ribosomal protein S18 acetylase RimI-like enzyme